MILAYLETHGSSMPKSSLAVIDAALKIRARHGGDRVVGLLLGAGDVQKAAQLAATYGLDEIVFVEDAQLEPYLSVTYSSAFVGALVELKPTVIVGASTSRGKDLFPRVAQAQSAGQASDVIDVLSGGVFKRPMYAGNVLAEVEITTPVKVVTIRASAFGVPTSSGAATPIRKISVAVQKSSNEEFVSFATVKSERPELGDASVVVSGGRALKSKENFEKLVLPLADALGGAVGASRAAVDSGYAPNDWQVGQTGKVVAPNLYIALGISGAIQHLAGMKDSKVIVAINSDPEAPIFEIADYGLVGDLYQIVPELISEIKKAKGLA